VYVRTIAPTTVPVEYEFVGRTEASKVVEIRARVQGLILKRDFEEGALIEAGHVLYRIDPSSFEAEVEVARAQRERAHAQVVNAAKQAARLQELAKQEAATQKEIDDWTTTQVQAMADQRLWDAQIALAQLNLSYCTITSPLRGKVGRTLKDIGALVDSGSNSLLTTVWQVDPMYVTFSIPEREWLQWKEDVEHSRIRLRTPEASVLQIVLLDGTVYQTPGRMDFLDATVNSQTGTTTARGVFENRTLPPKPGATASEEALKPGQFVRVRVMGWERPNALAVPQRAVLQTPGGALVMVVGEGSKVEMRPIKTGTWFGNEWVVMEGLRPGDRVIVEGFAKAPPGTIVRIAGEYAHPDPAPPGGPGAGGAGKTPTDTPAGG
jgi:membrane fusion protein (multidrug efflux system)